MKLNITPGPWTFVRPEISNGYFYVNAFGDTTGRTATCYDGDKFPDNAAAIVTAVNNTYHKGINPESVPDMLDALKMALQTLIVNYPLYKECPEYEFISKSIQKATL